MPMQASFVAAKVRTHKCFGMIFVLLSSLRCEASGKRRLFLVVSPARAPPTIFQLDSRAEPSLVIGGIDKGGTTDAWSLIKGETRVVTGSGTGNDSKELGCLLRPTPSDAKKCYTKAFSQERAAKRAASNGSVAELPTMDATPSYLWGWRQARDVPRMLSLVSPRAIAVFLLREPISRIKSLYNHWTRITGPGGSRTPEHVYFGPRLDDHIRLELEYLESPGQRAYSLLLHNKPPFMHNYRALLEGFGLWLGSDLSRCANITGSKNKPTLTKSTRCNYFVSFVLSSVYASHLHHWMSYFANSMLVVQSEAYFQRRDVLLSMLELPSQPRSGENYLSNLSVMPVVNKGVYTDRDSSEPSSFSCRLSPSVAARLATFLVEPNTRLRSLLETESRTGKIAVAPHLDSPQAWIWLGSDYRRRHSK